MRFNNKMMKVTVFKFLGNGPGMALEVCVQARNVGCDLAHVDNEIMISVRLLNEVLNLLMFVKYGKAIKFCNLVITISSINCN